MEEKDKGVNELMTASQAARYLNVSIPTFNLRVRSGLIRPLPTGGKWRKYERSELDRFLIEWNKKDETSEIK